MPGSRDKSTGYIKHDQWQQYEQQWESEQHKEQRILIHKRHLDDIRSNPDGSLHGLRVHIPISHRTEHSSNLDRDDIAQWLAHHTHNDFFRFFEFTSDCVQQVGVLDADCRSNAE